MNNIEVKIAPKRLIHVYSPEKYFLRVCLDHSDLITEEVLWKHREDWVDSASSFDRYPFEFGLNLRTFVLFSNFASSSNFRNAFVITYQNVMSNFSELPLRDGKFTCPISLHFSVKFRFWVKTLQRCCNKAVDHEEYEKREQVCIQEKQIAHIV